jgi:predicted  nucleic acid-binding Zn-ribbon protein
VVETFQGPVALDAALIAKQQAKITALQLSVAQEKSSVQLLKNEVQVLANRLHSLTDQIGLLQHQVSALNEHIVRLQEHIVSLDNQLKESLATLVNLKKVIDKMLVTEAHLKKELANAISITVNLEKQIGKLNKHVTALIVEKDKLTVEVHELNADLAKLQVKINQLLAELKFYKDQSVYYNATFTRTGSKFNVTLGPLSNEFKFGNCRSILEDTTNRFGNADELIINMKTAVTDSDKEANYTSDELGRVYVYPYEILATDIYAKVKANFRDKCNQLLLAASLAPPHLTSNRDTIGATVLNNVVQLQTSGGSTSNLQDKIILTVNKDILGFYTATYESQNDHFVESNRILGSISSKIVNIQEGKLPDSILTPKSFSVITYKVRYN